MPPRLAALAQGIRIARAEVRALRAAPVVPANLLSARQTLLSAMEAYAEELTVLRLPIPPQLRDDLRLQRDIRRHPNVSPWRITREPDPPAPRAPGLRR